MTYMWQAQKVLEGVSWQHLVILINEAVTLAWQIGLVKRLWPVEQVGIGTEQYLCSIAQVTLKGIML